MKSERCFVAVEGDGRRTDLATTPDTSVHSVVEAAGLTFDPTRHGIVDHNGSPLAPDTTVDAIGDGGLIYVVDVSAQASSRSAVPASSQPRDPLSPWLIAAFVGAILAAVSLISPHLLTERAVVPGVATAGLGALTVIVTVAWARRAYLNPLRDAVTMSAPLSLAFVTALAAGTALGSSTHLAVVVGLVGVSVVAGLMRLVAPHADRRATAGSVTIIGLCLTAIWAATLWAGWPSNAAALITLGFTVPALRLVPTTVLTLKDGYHIEFSHFMSLRWTVRGVIPEHPGEATMKHIKPHVSAALARLTTATVMVSVVAVVATNHALAHLSGGSTLARFATVVTLALTVVGLALVARQSALGAVRWVPRVAAALIAVQVLISVVARVSAPAQLLIAGALFAMALITAALVPAIYRGARSLAWSRVADVFEWLCVALAPALSLLGADVFVLAREMMAG